MLGGLRLRLRQRLHLCLGHHLHPRRLPHSQSVSLLAHDRHQDKQTRLSINLLLTPPLPQLFVLLLLPFVLLHFIRLLYLLLLVL